MFRTLRPKTWTDTGTEIAASVFALGLVVGVIAALVNLPWDKLGAAVGMVNTKLAWLDEPHGAWTHFEALFFFGVLLWIGNTLQKIARLLVIIARK